MRHFDQPKLLPLATYWQDIACAQKLIRWRRARVNQIHRHSFEAVVMPPNLWRLHYGRSIIQILLCRVGVRLDNSGCENSWSILPHNCQDLHHVSKIQIRTETVTRN